MMASLPSSPTLPPLSESECAIIACHPTGEQLDALRASIVDLILDYPPESDFEQTIRSLSTTDRSYCPFLPLFMIADDAFELVFNELLLQLIETFAGLSTSASLRSRNTPSISLRRDLFSYFSVAASRKYDIRITSVLLHTLLGPAPHARHVRPADNDLWIAVFTLLTIPRSQRTPPPTQSRAPTPVSFSSASTILSSTTNQPTRANSLQQTPLKVNSSSHMQNGGTHQILDPYLRFELNHVLYPNAQGFFARFFNKPDWTAAAQNLLRDCRHRNGPQNPLGWREPATDPVVSSWFYEFVNRQCLVPSSRRFYASRHRALTGAKSARKCDIFLYPVRAAVESAPTGKHDFHWPDVLVPAELKQEPKTCNSAEVVLQLACYVREVFGAQPTRRFVHAFTICRDMMRCWVFHRAGGVGSRAFEIKREPERFLTAIVAYSMMDETELGFDPSVVRPQHALGLSSDEYPVNVITVSLPNGEYERLELHPTPLFHRPVIASRGTVCWKARRIGGDTWDLVVKDAWRAEERSPEGNLLLRAAQCGVWGVAKYYTHQDIVIAGAIDSTQNITGAGVAGTSLPVRFLAGKSHDKHDDWAIPRAGATSSESTAGASVADTSSTNKRKAKSGSGASAASKRQRQSTISQPSPQKPDNRIHSRTIVSSVGRPLTSFRTIRELLEAFRDAIKGHHSLLTLAHILHRDISINNIMIASSPAADSPRGFLIDLDLAIRVGTSASAASGAPHRTGTMEFMAIGVLLGHQHTFRHDLESFLYVFLWICVHYDGPTRLSKGPATALLATWSQHEFVFAAVIKEGYMAPAGYQRLLDGFAEYFAKVPGVVRLAREWREVVFEEEGGCEVVYARVVEAIERAVEGIV